MVLSAVVDSVCSATKFLQASSYLNTSRTHPKLSSQIILMHWYYLSSIWGTTHKPEPDTLSLQHLLWLLIIWKCSGAMTSIKKQANYYEVSFTGGRTLSLDCGYPTTWISHGAWERSEFICSNWIFYNFALQFYYLLIYNLLLITSMAGKPVLQNFHQKKKCWEENRSVISEVRDRVMSILLQSTEMKLKYAASCILPSIALNINTNT